jgi:hypothetical protein
MGVAAMAETSDELSHYQVDHLLLLVGGNPLPNAVAGMVLGKREGRITLIHTQETFDIAQRLATWFVTKKFQRPALKQVKESEANSVYDAIGGTLHHFSDGLVGLNYTGGTKAMAVHAYRATEAWGREHGLKPVFTYLDARTLEMVIDAPHPESGEFAQTIPLALQGHVELADLFSMHGWENKSEPTNQPFLPHTSAAFLEVHQNPTALAEWDNWKQNVLLKECRRADRPEKWKSQGQLRQIQVPWPNDPLPANDN